MHKVPMGLVLSRMADQPEGSLQVIIEETAHLPKQKDFSLALETIRGIFRASGNEQVIAPQVRKLMSMSRSLLSDRKTLRPVLKNIRCVLREWDEWLEVSGGATEEELQAHLERLADAISQLREAWQDYEGDVLKKLKNED